MLEARPNRTSLASVIASFSSEKLLDCEDRTESLFLHDVVRLCDAGDDGRLEEESGFARTLSAGNDLGRRRQVRDLVAHGVEVIDVVERAVEGIRIGRRSGAQLLGVPDEGFDELIVDGLVNDHASGRGAILAAVEERCLGDAGGGLLDVDVAEDDRRRFAAQFEVRALELLCCGHGDSDARPAPNR